MGIEIDLTENAADFVVDNYGDDHRIIIGDLEIFVTAEQLSSLSEEAYDHLASIGR